MAGQVALVMTQTGKPLIVGQYDRVDGTRVWRIWDCSATYDAVRKVWDAVAVKDSRRINTNRGDQIAFGRHWVLLAHFDTDHNLQPPFFGIIPGE